MEGNEGLGEGAHVAAVMSRIATGETRIFPLLRPDKRDNDGLPWIDVGVLNLGLDLELVPELGTQSAYIDTHTHTHTHTHT